MCLVSLNLIASSHRHNHSSKYGIMTIAGPVSTFLSQPQRYSLRTLFGIPRIRTHQQISNALSRY